MLWNLELEIVGNSWNGLRKNGQFITIDLTILRFKEHRVSVLPAREVINCKCPRTVCQLLDLVVAFYVDRNIHAEIIRDAILVAV